MISREKQTAAGLSESVHPGGSRASEALSAVRRLLPKFTTKFTSRVFKLRASAERQASARQVWDGEIADSGLALLSVDMNWDTVAADDLIFLLPSLTASTSGSASSTTAADYFHAACIDFEARISDGFAPIGASVPRVRRILETLLRRASAHEPANARHSDASACAYALSKEDVLSAEDAMLGALYGRIHPAYAAPEFVYLHESLMVASWLGHLVAGRDAWLRQAVAEPLGMLLAETAQQAALSEAATLRADPVANLIFTHADAAGGAKPLSRASAIVCETRQPRLIRASARQLVASGG